MHYTDEQKKEIKEVLYHDLRYSVTNFDTLTLTIGGGGLGLSLTFIDSVVPLKDASYIFLFYGALILFTIGIMLSFIGHIRNVDFLFKELTKLSGQVDYVASRSPIIIFNWLIAGFIILGVASLGAFVGINVNQARQIAVKDVGNETFQDSTKAKENLKMNKSVSDSIANVSIDTIRKKQP